LFARLPRCPVRAVFKRDAAVAALTQHFPTTMHLVELAAPGVSEISEIA
jgi:hypothetical protein